MKECPFCGEQIQDTAHKCRFCGEWLDKLCPECGHWSRVNVATCPECGFSFAGEAMSKVEPEAQVVPNAPEPEIQPIEQAVAQEPVDTEEPAMNESSEDAEPTVQTSGCMSSQAKRGIYLILTILASFGSVISVFVLATAFMDGGEISNTQDFIVSMIVTVSLVANASMLNLLKKKFTKPLTVALDWVSILCVLTSFCTFFNIGKWFLMLLLLVHCIARGVASRYLLMDKQADTARDTTFLGRLWAVEVVMLLAVSCMVFFAHRDAPTLFGALYIILIGWPIATCIEVGLLEKLLSARQDYVVLKNLLYFLLLSGLLALEEFKHIF